MPEPRDTYKYVLIQGSKVSKSITSRDLYTVEKEHQNEFTNSKIVKVGYKTTRESALKWKSKKD